MKWKYYSKAVLCRGGRIIMKIAVFSDIHSNYVAFEKCIEYVISKGANIFIFLGDYVGELGYPQKTMDIIYKLEENYECYFIKGNKENYWIDYRDHNEKGWKEYDSTTGSLYYTYNNLRQHDLKFFEELPYTKNICLEGCPPITICHGSPNKVSEKLLPDSNNTFAVMEQNANNMILCGHTHIQNVIKHKDKIIINPGSVGMALHGSGKSQFALLNFEYNIWKYELIDLDYDISKVIKDLDSSGLTEKAPSWCEVTKHLLKTGEVSHGFVMTRAMELCEQEMGECVWPNIPEKYWRKALTQILENN